jgi:hypothetical protein
MRKWTKMLAIILGVVIMASLAVGSVAVFALTLQQLLPRGHWYSSPRSLSQQTGGKAECYRGSA